MQAIVNHLFQESDTPYSYNKLIFLICGVVGSRNCTVLKCSGVESGLTKSYWTLQSIPAAFIIIKRVDIEPLYVNEGSCP